MPFASIAEVKNRLSEYLARARKTKQPIVVTRHGKPCALITAIDEQEAEDLLWSGLAQRQLHDVWEGDDDALYEYL